MLLLQLLIRALLRLTCIRMYLFGYFLHGLSFQIVWKQNLRSILE